MSKMRDVRDTMRESLGKRFLLGTLGAPAGVLGSGVEGPRRNQLLIAQIMKILKSGMLTITQLFRTAAPVSFLPSALV